MKNLTEVLKLCEEDIKSKNFYILEMTFFLGVFEKRWTWNISVSSNVVPKIISEICLFVQSDFHKGKKLDDKIKNLNQNLFCESIPFL